MRILGVDPGKTVGMSLNAPPDGPIEHAWERDFGVEEFEHALGMLRPDIIVYERFDHRQRNNVDLSGTRQISIIELHKSRTGCTIIGQTASYGKSFFDDKKLKFLKLYLPGRPHAMDAVRHRLQYELRAGLFDLHQLWGL